MRILLLVLGAIMMLVAMAITLILLGMIARGPNVEKFGMFSQVLIVSMFCLPVSWVCGFIFSRREIADQNRPKVVRHWLNLPFYVTSVHGFIWALAIVFGLR